MSNWSKHLVWLVVVLSLLSSNLGAAESSVRWDQLAPLVAGKQVWLPLSDGTLVEGIVRSVESGALQLDVRKSSDRKTYPKGSATIPASLVPVIYMNKLPGHKGAIIGGAVGGAISILAATVLSIERNNEGGTSGDGVLAAAAVAPVAIGLTVGWLSDRMAQHGNVSYRIDHSANPVK